MRQAVQRDGRRTSLYRMPAPQRGWVTNENFAANPGGGARVMENWFPTETGVRVRSGAERFAQIGLGAAFTTGFDLGFASQVLSAEVTRLFTYQSATSSRIFAASSNAIFDVTAVGDATVPTATVVSGAANGDWQTAQMVTAGGEFLVVVNGADDARLYNGTTWQVLDGDSTPAITEVATADLVDVWAFKNRLFFIEKDSLSTWYLPVDSIGGAATNFTLWGVFPKGGALLFGATWSTADSGTGQDDRWVVVTDQGEAAVYQGTDPSDATAWALVGVYDIGKPLGRNAWHRVAGDILIATRMGLISLNEAILKDPAALRLSAMSRPIEDQWNAEAVLRTEYGWQMAILPRLSMMLITLPTANDALTKGCFAVNLTTRAWAFYSGWDARAIVEWNQEVYFGTPSGVILKAETGGTDDGVPYEAKLALATDHMATVGAYKHVSLVRGVFNARVPFAHRISVGKGYEVAFPPRPEPVSPGETAGLDLWGSALWGIARWGGGTTRRVVSAWRGVGRQGAEITAQVQVAPDATGAPNVDLLTLEFMQQPGGTVV